MSSSLEESSTAQARDPFRDRTAPRAPEAEQAVIAAMLMDTDAILRAGEHVDDTMFYDERHRRIFRAMIAISQRNRTGSLWTAAVRWFGRNSYEVYLTHMFVVFGLHRIFELMGSPYRWSLLWYAAIIPITGVLGAVVARYFSEPLNRRLRPKLTTQYTTH